MSLLKRTSKIPNRLKMCLMMINWRTYLAVSSSKKKRRSKSRKQSRSRAKSKKKPRPSPKSKTPPFPSNLSKKTRTFPKSNRSVLSNKNLSKKRNPSSLLFRTSQLSSVLSKSSLTRNIESSLKIFRSINTKEAISSRNLWLQLTPSPSTFWLN